MIFDLRARRVRNEAGGNILTLDNPAGWLTGSPPVTGRAAAMKVSAVNRCVELLSDSMAKLPIFVMDSRTKEHLSGHYLGRVLWERPNEAMTPTVYKKLMECNRLLRGNGYAWVYRSPRDARPQELIPLPPECVTPFVDERGHLWYMFAHPRTGEVRKLWPEDVLHYKAYSEDGITGISVLERAREAIETARSAQKFERRVYEFGGQPSGVLQTGSDLTSKTGKDGRSPKDELRAEWERIHAGADNAFRVAVLDLGLEYKPIGMSMTDAQFVEGKGVSVEDISRFFGVPLYKLNAGKQAYNSNEANAIEYVTGTLHANVTQYEEEDTYKLLVPSDRARGLEVRRNMMAELRGNFASRSVWYRAMREIGAFSVNDVLELEDMPAVEGGETHYASLNYVPLEDFRELSRRRAEKGGNGS